MEIVFGWLIVALYLLLAIIFLPEYGWLAAMFVAWLEAGELFGEQAVGAFGLAVALTVVLVGWGRNVVRWMHRRRSPLLVGQRGVGTAGGRR